MAHKTEDLLYRSAELAEGMAAIAAQAGVQATPGTKLPSGGALSLWIQTGHYEVTQEAAEAFGFSSAAQSILCDASQDPDFYEFDTCAAHAQSPSALGPLSLHSAKREQGEAAAIDGYKKWVLVAVNKCQHAASAGQTREALYFLGYALHGVEDLAAHGGLTSPEHAASHPSPDEDPRRVEQSRGDAREFLRAVAKRLGPARFDALRGYSGEGQLLKHEKERLLGLEWNAITWAKSVWRYKHSAVDWAWTYDGVRWPVARVFAELLETLAGTTQHKDPDATAPIQATETTDEPLVFTPLTPATLTKQVAEWTVMVYMAGDDASPSGIEYAIRQDLRELKLVGATDAVHLLAQTDECRTRASYRYRLRHGTQLAADRLAVYNGEVNTGKVESLVDFVSFAVEQYPAKHYALVLWGHGSGHDDKDVYRAGRGRISPRLAARLAQKRLGFFGGTRRDLLSRQGPNRGYGFDSTAADFLDNRELKRALGTICHKVLGRKLDLLGFDACLMANLEVAYQLHDSVALMVASEEVEPGDGWAYQRAFARLVLEPTTTPEKLGKMIVNAFGEAYDERQALSLCKLSKVEKLAETLEALAQELTAHREVFHVALNAATDMLPGEGQGYRDLGAFLAALEQESPASVAKAAQAANACYGDAIHARVGGGSGLTIYLPGKFAPDVPGSTDALYELLDFPRRHGWSALLRAVYRAPGKGQNDHCPPPSKPRFGSRAGLDRHNAVTILQGLLPDTAPMDWMDLSRRGVLGLEHHDIPGVLQLLRTQQEASNLRLFVVPGIMGSQLADQKGPHGTCWVDPVGLALGSDYQTLRLAPSGQWDADPAVRLKATTPIPLLYDRLVLALLAAFGPCVEQLAYDWRRSLTDLAEVVAARFTAELATAPTRELAIVAHSMGGLVAAGAIHRLTPAERRRVKGLITIGTPWHGSYRAALVAKGQDSLIKAFATLTPYTAQQTADVAQTFWGLTQMLPDDASALQNPRLYAPGPLAAAPLGTPRLSSPGALGLRPPSDVPTLAIAGNAWPTLVGLTPTAGEWDKELGPGDGTVPLTSAIYDNTQHCHLVSAAHSLLPLDGEVIRVVQRQLAAWTDRAPLINMELAPLPHAPAASNRQTFLGQLEESWSTPLPLETLRSLLFLM